MRNWWAINHDARCNIEIIGAEPLIPTGDCTCGAIWQEEEADD